MIRDDTGNPLTYWPEGLIAGQDSQVLVIRVDTPQDRMLVAQHDERMIVYVRATDSGDDFVALTEAPVDLSVLPGLYTRFDVKVHADGEIGPFVRFGITFGARRQAPAAWGWSEEVGGHFSPALPTGYGNSYGEAYGE